MTPGSRIQDTYTIFVTAGFGYATDECGTATLMASTWKSALQPLQ